MRDPDLKMARTVLNRLGARGRLRRVATGLDTTYRADVDDGRTLAVRVAGPFSIRRPGAVLMEAAWIDALGRDGRVRVPEVVAPRTFDEPPTILDIEGNERGYLVLGWLAGRKMRWRFAPHHAYALGAAAARLHRHAVTFQPPGEAWAKTWTPSMHCGAANPRPALSSIAGADAAAVVEAIENRLVAAFATLRATDWVLVNGDLGPHNAVWLHGSAGLFDFNDLGWGYTTFDLARYLHGLRWRPAGPRLVDAALDGYRSVAPLPEGFRAYGSLFEVAAGLFLAHYLAPKVPERGEDAARTIRAVVDNARAHLAANRM